MRSNLRSLALIASALLASQLPAASEPSHGTKGRYATQADVDRLERELAEQKQLVAKLISLQQQYLAGLSALVPDSGRLTAAPLTIPEAKPPKEDPSPAQPPVVVAAKPVEKRPTAAVSTKGNGTILGRVKGGSSGDTYVYVEDLGGADAHGSAAMKQQDKQFVPRVLVVPKGTQVQFPNMDTVFHNVFSVTPDNTFDLGSYRQGESKSVRLIKPGVVNIYCNMHPQMVGFILVVPGSYYTRVGSDGFYRLAGVPAGHHRLVAWTPNAKPSAIEVDVADGEPATAEFQLHASGSAPHTNKDGLPYGSYKE